MVDVYRTIGEATDFSNHPMMNVINPYVSFRASQKVDIDWGNRYGVPHSIADNMERDIKRLIDNQEW